MCRAPTEPAPERSFRAPTPTTELPFRPRASPEPDIESPLSVKTAAPQTSRWRLLGDATRSGEMSEVAIEQSPFSVGRNATHRLVLPFPGVSSTHAALRLNGSEELWVEDLASTNGTWVNGLRIERPTRLAHGDVVQFGEVAFSVEWRDPSGNSRDGDTHELSHDHSAYLRAAKRIDELIDQRRLRTLFQPIVRIDGGVAIGFESLVRSEYEQTPERPRDLFELAAVRHREADLSAISRELAIERIAPLVHQRAVAGQRRPDLYSNVHPKEAVDERFPRSIEALRSSHPEIPLVLEFDNLLQVDSADRRLLFEELRGLGVGIALSELGSGISRLGEMSVTPPDVLKIGGPLIALLSPGNARMLRLCETLVEMAHELGSLALAQEVETPEQYALCRDIGFDLAQGFAVSRPLELEQIAGGLDVPDS